MPMRLNDLQKDFLSEKSFQRAVFKCIVLQPLASSPIIVNERSYSSMHLKGNLVIIEFEMLSIKADNWEKEGENENLLCTWFLWEQSCGLKPRLPFFCMNRKLLWVYRTEEKSAWLFIHTFGKQNTRHEKALSQQQACQVRHMVVRHLDNEIAWQGKLFVYGRKDHGTRMIHELPKVRVSLQSPQRAVYPCTLASTDTVYTGCIPFHYNQFQYSTHLI